MTRTSLALSLSLAALCAVCSGAWAQRGFPVGDAQIVEQAQLVASGERVEIYQHGLRVDPAVLKLAEDAYRQLETLTGRKLDTATLGPKIRIYVSDSVGISHVWRGYQHPHDPKGIIFLNPRVYLGALSGRNAIYVHEMAHLFTWRYQSHTLREGLADYLALRVLPGAAVGPNPDGYNSSLRIPAEVLEYLGTTKPPPAWVVSDPRMRVAYYFASYRFVNYLVENGGMERFLALYDSENPESEMAKLYGASREDLIRRAGM